MRRLLYLIPLALFLVIAGYFASALLSGHDSRLLPSALLDKPAPDFALPPLKDDGAGFTTADLKGHPSLVNVFASWCVPCKVEHPVLMKLAAEKLVPIYGINWKDKRADALKWLNGLGDPFTRIGLDEKGRVGIDWGVYGVPETYVVDAQGTIRYKHVGPLTQQDVERTILPMLLKIAQ